MNCPNWVPTCLAGDTVASAAADAAGTAAGGFVQDAVVSVATGIYEAFLAMFAWSIALWTEFSPSPADFLARIDAGAKETVALLASAILVLVLISSAIQVMWRRDGAVLADAAVGVFKMVLVVAAGTAVVLTMWQLSEELTDRLKPDSSTIDAATGVSVFAIAPGIGMWLPLLLLLLSVVGVFLSLGMVLLMAFRTASIAILALLLPVAAAGSPGTSTRAWLPKVVGWLMALIFLRPMIALIYRIGLGWMAGGTAAPDAALAGPEGQAWASADSAGGTVASVVVGMMTMLVAMFALPSLLRLFTWMFGGGPGGGGAGLAAAGLAANAGMARGRLSAARQAASTAGDLGPSGGGVGGASGAAPSAGGGPGGSPAGGSLAVGSGASPSAASSAAAGSALPGAGAAAGGSAAVGPAAATGGGGAAVAAGTAAAGPVGAAVGAAVAVGKVAVKASKDAVDKGTGADG